MIVEVVVAVIRDAAGRVLTVRKRGTRRFMLPGGKREAGEDDVAALARELREELDAELVASRLLGEFEAPAANEPGATVKGSVYAAEIIGDVRTQAEIEDLLWIEPAAPPSDVSLAPLLEHRVLPILTDPPPG